MIGNTPEAPSKSDFITSTPALRCRNCGHEFEHNYCPKCGQHHADHNTSIWSIVKEFLDEFLRLDSKFLRTLVPLLFRPGFLTQEWVKGRRVRYITPLKIYVTISALSILVLSLHSSTVNFHMNFSDPEQVKEIKQGVKEGNLGASLVNDMIINRKFDNKTVMDQFFSRLPTASLVLVPFAAVLLWVLYLRRSRYFVEHLVFVLHFSSFTYLMIAAVELLPKGAYGGLAFLWGCVYLYMALKRNYEQGWGKTFLKYSLFSFSYTMLVCIGLLATLVFSAIISSKKETPTPESKPESSVTAPVKQPTAPKPTSLKTSP